MIELIGWIFVLVFLLSVCVAYSKHVLLTPQFVYVGCFLPQAILALYFVHTWHFRLSTETMCVLVGGTTLFVVASIIFGRFFSRLTIRSARISVNGQREERVSPVIFVERWKLLFLLLFQVIAIVIYIVYGLGSLPGATLGDKMLYLNNNAKFADAEDAVLFQRWISWPRKISESANFITGYLLVHSVVFKYKQKRTLLIISLFLGILNVFITGGRISIVGLIVSLVIQAYFMWGDSIDWKKRISMRLIFKIIIVGIIILTAFQWSLRFIGRSDNQSFLDYLGLYISAPLRNLDAFVRIESFGNNVHWEPIYNWETMRLLINHLGRTFGITKWVHQYNLPFLFRYGINFGNVYTLYHAYLHDGGYSAVVVFVLLEALITQILYRKLMGLVNRRAMCRGQINISLILYSYVIYLIFLGFFMERFFTDFISTTMVRTIICWWLVARFFTTRFHFSKS